MFLGGCSFLDQVSSRSKSDDDDEDEEEIEETEEEEETEETEETEESQETEASTETEPTETEVTETSKAPVEYEKFSDGFPKAYLPVIDKCLYHLSGNVAEDDVYLMPGFDEYTQYYSFTDTMTDPWDQFLYALVDLNEDGAPEFVAVQPQGYSPDSYVVAALFTIVNGEAVEVIESYARDSYFLTSDLELVECGSGGAAYSIWKKYKLNDVGGLDFVEGYFTDYEEFDESGAPVADSDIVWYKILDGYNYSSTENSEFYCDIDGFDKTIDEYVFEGDELVPFGHAEHRYEVIIEDAKFDEAKAACEAMGGHLVAIETEEEAAVIQKIMSYYYADEKLLFTGAEDGVWPNGEKVGKFLFPEGKIIREGYLGTQISGEDGSFHLVSMSSDPMGEEYYYSGFIGYICEFEPS